MSDAATVRRLALALPGTIEQDHHGRPSFRVAGRIFATLWDPGHVNIMLDQAGIMTVVQAPPMCVAGLDPDWIHGLHGGSLARETIPQFVQALREEPFAYKGKCSGASSQTEP
ncbi:MAG: hypothetical protein ACR2HD_08460 [Solirubrobacteraceae bacterium]|nr:MAG: hypothetical protein DLM63_03485 [Solirubrobacterales bacterium]